MNASEMVATLPEIAAPEACARVVHAVLDAAERGHLDTLTASAAVRDTIVYHLDPLA